MKEIIKLGLILFVITAISAGILGFAYDITKEPIEKQVRLANQEAMTKALPQSEKFEKVEVDIPEASNIIEVNAGYKGDLLDGYK